MAGEVLRMNIFAKFELWCFVSTAVLKCRHYAKPRTVIAHLKDANVIPA
ncbi:MAG: hypothetical protein OKBPIBMD_00263 [Chlorobi bacterium]|nr:hypothetical protein [Chlorobiota bacterium]